MATEAREEKRAEEARKRGKRRKGQPYGSIIRYERLGPYYRQEGVEIINMPSGTVAHKPRLRQYFVHRFLHATKGWRSSTHVPAGMRGA